MRRGGGVRRAEWFECGSSWVGLGWIGLDWTRDGGWNGTSEMSVLERATRYGNERNGGNRTDETRRQQTQTATRRTQQTTPTTVLYGLEAF